MPPSHSPAHQRAAVTPPTPPLQRVRSMSRPKVNIDEMVGALTLTSSITLLVRGDSHSSPGRSFANVSESSARSAADAKFENRVQETHRLTVLHHTLRQLADTPLTEAQARHVLADSEGKARSALGVRMQRSHTHVASMLRTAAVVKRPLSATTVKRRERRQLLSTAGDIVSPTHRPLLSVSVSTPRSHLRMPADVSTPTSLFRQLNDSSSYSKTSYDSSPVSPIPVGRQYRRSLMGVGDAASPSPAMSQESFIAMMASR